MAYRIVVIVDACLATRDESGMFIEGSQNPHPNTGNSRKTYCSYCGPNMKNVSPTLHTTNTYHASNCANKRHFSYYAPAIMAKEILSNTHEITFITEAHWRICGGEVRDFGRSSPQSTTPSHVVDLP